MSLYNAIFGFDENAGMVLKILDVEFEDLPRFRDAWFDPDAFEFVIHTRTGGGNRSAYSKGNDYLRGLPGFLRDEDDPFDNTYASFYYAVPTNWTEHFRRYAELGYGRREKPHERWKRVIDGMKRNDRSDPDVVRALDEGARVIGPILEQLGIKPNRQ